MSEPNTAFQFNKKHLKQLLILQIIFFVIAIVLGTIGVLHQNPWAASLGQTCSLLVGLLLGIERGPELWQRLAHASK